MLRYITEWGYLRYARITLIFHIEIHLKKLLSFHGLVWSDVQICHVQNISRVFEMSGLVFRLDSPNGRLLVDILQTDLLCSQSHTSLTIR